MLRTTHRPHSRQQRHPKGNRRALRSDVVDAPLTFSVTLAVIAIDDREQAHGATQSVHAVAYFMAARLEKHAAMRLEEHAAAKDEDKRERECAFRKARGAAQRVCVGARRRSWRSACPRGCKSASRTAARYEDERDRAFKEARTRSCVGMHAAVEEFFCSFFMRDVDVF
jgi:hypothetical protein